MEKEKLPYEKPMMVIEYYELTQTISSCDVKANFADRDSYGYYDENGKAGMFPTVVFMNKGVCDTINLAGGWTDSDKDFHVCFTTSTGYSKKLFSS